MMSSILIKLVQRRLDRDRLIGRTLTAALRTRPQAARTAKELSSVHHALRDAAAQWRTGQNPTGPTPDHGPEEGVLARLFLAGWGGAMLAAAAIVVAAVVGASAWFAAPGAAIQPDPELASQLPPITPEAEPDAALVAEQPTTGSNLLARLDPTAAPKMLEEARQSLAAPFQEEWSLLLQDLEGGLRPVQLSVESVLDAHDEPEGEPSAV